MSQILNDNEIKEFNKNGVLWKLLTLPLKK